MTHYDKILMETAFSSPETLVPVWKNKAPSKQDLVDRSPLIDRAGNDHCGQSASVQDHLL